jgi:hypothetical protein
MDLVLKSPDDAPYEAGRDFSVMISFDDSVSAERADEVLELLDQHLKEEQGRLFHQWWNTEVLAFTSMRELAAAEAAWADMIIIVIREGPALPETVAAWMKRSLDLRKDRPGALVAMLDSDLPKPDTSQGVVSQLQQAAAAGHMDFFATRGNLRKDNRAALRAGQAARQFALARKNGAPPGWPGRRRVPAEARGAWNETSNKYKKNENTN